jgi:hypothetical protein
MSAKGTINHEMVDYRSGIRTVQGKFEHLLIPENKDAPKEIILQSQLEDAPATQRKSNLSKKRNNGVGLYATRL